MDECRRPGQRRGDWSSAVAASSVPVPHRTAGPVTISEGASLLTAGQPRGLTCGGGADRGGVDPDTSGGDRLGSTAMGDTGSDRPGAVPTRRACPVIRFIHSSDIHLGKPFGRYPEDIRVRLRQARAENTRLREELEQAKANQKSLNESLRHLDNEIERIYEEIIRLSNK